MNALVCSMEALRVDRRKAFGAYYSYQLTVLSGYAENPKKNCYKKCDVFTFTKVSTTMPKRFRSGKF